MEGLTVQTVKQYLANLKRAAMRRAPDARVVCTGGPFDGEPLALTLDGDGRTLHFKSRGLSGSYRATIFRSYKLPRSESGHTSNGIKGSAVWIPE
jgi:hypothetical protein